MDVAMRLLPIIAEGDAMSAVAGCPESATEAKVERTYSEPSLKERGGCGKRAENG